MSEIKNLETKFLLELHNFLLALHLVHADAVKAAVATGATLPTLPALPAYPPAPVPVKDGQAIIKAWGAPAIDWAKTTAAELSAIYALAQTRGPTTSLDYATGNVTWQGGQNPDPNFEIQGRVVRGLPTTETERAYVWYNNADGIDAHFTTGAGGVTVKVA